MPDLSLLGLREYLLLAAGLVAVYLVVLVLRLQRPKMIPGSPVASGSGQVREFSRDKVEPEGWVATDTTDATDSAFAQQLAQSAVGLEVQWLRRETQQLRAELSRLSEEVRQLKATHNVSPVYSEAMSLAKRGELPAGIAARCGISIGEAELVAALASREFGAALDSELDQHRRDA